MGYAVAQLVWHCVTSHKVAGLISDGVFEVFFIDLILPAAYDPGFDSPSNRNEYQGPFLGSKGGRCVGLTTLPPSCAGCLEILGAPNLWRPVALSSLQWDNFSF